jgi:hypothetical protein
MLLYVLFAETAMYASHMYEFELAKFVEFNSKFHSVATLMLVSMKIISYRLGWTVYSRCYAIGE